MNDSIHRSSICLQSDWYSSLWFPTWEPFWAAISVLPELSTGRWQCRPYAPTVLIPLRRTCTQRAFYVVIFATETYWKCWFNEIGIFYVCPQAPIMPVCTLESFVSVCLYPDPTVCLSPLGPVCLFPLAFQCAFPFPTFHRAYNRWAGLPSIPSLPHRIFVMLCLLWTNIIIIPFYIELTVCTAIYNV